MTTPIDWLTVPNRKGCVGMMSCPGGSRWHGTDDDALRRDLGHMHSAGASCLVSLLPDDEMGRLGVTQLGALAAVQGVRWLQLAVEDMRAPGEGFEIRWGDIGPKLHAELTAGRHVVLHCYAGLGRTGTVAARLLVETGIAPPDAIRLVRAARPGAIQNLAQERYVMALAPSTTGGHRSIPETK